VGESLDRLRLEVVQSGEREEGIAKNAHHLRVSFSSVLYLGLDGVQDATKVVDLLNSEADEHLFHGDDQPDGFLVVGLAEGFAESLRIAQVGVHGPSPLSAEGR